MATIESFTIYKGNSWTPGIEITDNSVAKDCTDYECMLIIKSTDSYTADVVLSEDISWTERSAGTGTFTILPTESDDLANTYYYEIVLYKADDSYRKTMTKGKLVVEGSLGIE